MTYNEKKRLFGEALLLAFKEKYEEELALCELHENIPAAYSFAMEKIIIDHGIKEKQKKKAKLAALLIAAALLLAGCTAYVCRDAIREFTARILSDRIEIDFGNDKGNQMHVIEEVYYLSYVPEGYEQITNMTNESVSLYRWKNENNEMIVFSQHLIDGVQFDVDSERGEVITVEGYENTVFHTVIDEKHHYIWNDGKYAMTLEISTNHSTEEIRKIITGISAK